MFVVLEINVASAFEMRLVDGAPNPLIRTWNPKVNIDIDDPGT